MKNKKINDKYNSSSKLKPKDELVHLINNLNSAIKLYYNSTINIILNSKKNILNTNKKNDLINIENNLLIFIKDAKYLFNRMKIVRKQSLIEEKQNKKNQGQLYNYCNNNFFYYSNAPTNVKTNPNYFTKILNYGHHQKVIYNSPTNKTHNISKNKSDIINYTQNSYQKFNKERKKLLSSDNSISKEIKSKISIPKLKIETYDKDKLIENILNLLKQINKFNYKIFNEVKEAKYIKKIFNMILSDLNKLIEVLSKENEDKTDTQCLTERKKIKSCIQNDILIGKNKNGNNLRNIKDLKHNSNLFQKFNRTYNNNNIISRNPINQQRYLFSIQKIKSRNESISVQEKNIRAKSESSKDKEIFKNKIQDNSIVNKTKGKYIRDILIKEGIKEYNNIKKEKDDLLLSDKEQQTENNEIKTEIIKERNICIEPEQNLKLKEIERENLIKDLENKIKILNDDIKTLNDKILNLQKENDIYKNESENQNNQINYLNQKLILLNQYIDKKEKKSKKEENEKEKEKNDNIIIDNNIENKNASNSINEETETDLDKLSIKYELLKLDFDKQKSELEEKDKLLKNYNLYRNLIDSKSSEEKINELLKKHEKEIEQLNQKYIKDILELKTNLPNCFTPSTHEILIDKKFSQYELHWYLLTLTAAKKKDYENTFWVSEDEIKNMLNEFKAFKTEEDIEKENMNIYILSQQKLINRIESNEDKITNLKKQIQKLKGCK